MDAQVNAPTMAPSPAAMLDVQDLRVSYKGVLAVAKASLKVEAGQIVALAGGNGNGKSTVLRAIAGLNRPDAGRIFFNGQAIENLKAHQRVRLGLSLVPEGRRLFHRMTVERNLQLGAFTRTDTHQTDETMQRVFQLFPVLKQRLRQTVGTMSGGEQQMVVIARGLMARPKLLMLDEPSWGVAPKLVRLILDIIQEINRMGVSVLLVEQNLHKALAIAHYGYVIQTGHMVLEGQSQSLLENEDIKKAYLGL